MSDELFEGQDPLAEFIASQKGDPPPAPAPKDPAPDPESAADDGLDDDTLTALDRLEGAAKEPATGEDDGPDDLSDEDLTRLATALGVTTDDLGRDGKALKIKTKVDGETAWVSLEEMRAGTQLQRHFTRQQEQFLQAQKQWDQTRLAREQEVAHREQLAREILDGAEQEVIARYTKSPEYWKQLEQDDPVQFSVETARFNRELQEVQARKQRFEAQAKARGEREAAEQQQAMAQHMAQEQQKLADALGWTKPGVTPEARQKHAAEIYSYLTERVGFQPQELQNVLDHRAYVLIDKARKYDELLAQRDLAKKRVTETPPVPSAVRTGRSVKSDQAKVTALKERALATGRESDRLAAARAIMGM